MKKSAFVRLVSAMAAFCCLFFYRIRIYDASSCKEYMPCYALWSKYKHTQKSVVSWNGYSAYRLFLNISEKKFIIPGLEEGFVPQGITFCEALNSFMISGYSSDGGAAFIITVDSVSGRINGEYEIRKSNGDVFTGHSGGIAVYGKYVYITDGYKLYYAPASGFNSGSSVIVISGEICLPASASFLSSYDGYLWAGNFYHRSLTGKYDRTSEDKYGNKFHTLIVGYRFDSSAEGGIRCISDGVACTAVPYLGIYAPDEVQGAAFLDSGGMHLSCSYGRTAMSMQLLYRYPLERKNDSSEVLGGKSIPVWFLNNDTLVRAVSTLPMSEGAVSRDGKVYVVFESAAKKYYDTALDPTDCVWEIDWK